jgi:hypothetical protein
VRADAASWTVNIVTGDDVGRKRNQLKGFSTLHSRPAPAGFE